MCLNEGLNPKQPQATTLTYKNEVIKILDGSCWREGGPFLIKDLGFEEQN